MDNTYPFEFTKNDYSNLQILISEQGKAIEHLQKVVKDNVIKIKLLELKLEKLEQYKGLLNESNC